MQLTTSDMRKKKEKYYGRKKSNIVEYLQNLVLFVADFLSEW